MFRVLEYLLRPFMFGGLLFIDFILNIHEFMSN